MNKKIILSDDKKKELEVIFDCSRITVWLALSFKSNSKLARKIRVAAIVKGGEQIGGANKIDGAPDFVTYFDEVNECMIQAFGERVRIIVSMKNPTGSIEVDGEVVEHIEKVYACDMPKWQEKAQQIVNNLK